MAAPITVRPAREPDLATVLAILSGASEWERSRGIEDPWPYPFPAEQVRPALARGEVYLAHLAPLEAVATLSLTWEDPRFWRERPPDAGYVHRLAVLPAWAGRSIGGALLDWAAAEVRSRGRRFLRLDCLSTNLRLVRYYLDQGFEPRGTVEVDGFVCARFERPVAP